MKIDGKIAIITGAGRGIGKATAEAFIAQGAIVIIASITKKSCQETAAELGDHAYPIATDVSDRRSVEAMVKEVISEFGHVDILINNAGIHGAIGPFNEVDPEEWWNAVTVNLGGTFHCSSVVVPSMIQNGGGTIVNFAGGGATGLRNNFSAYAASKTAIVRLTENMGAELDEHNIRVNCISPGAIATRLQQEIIDLGESVVGRDAMEDAEDIKKQKKGVPVTVPAELALWLATENSAPLTGKVISSVWDGWKEWTDKQRMEINASEAFTLRRLKEDLTF